MQPALARAEPPDGDILALLQGAGAEPAFARLLERYAAKVYRLCCAMLRDPALAQDVAQESWIRIWKALPTYDRHAAALGTWIYAITRNRCLSAIERRREWLSLEGTEIEGDVEAEAGEAPDPDDRYRVLRELVDLLPERYRRTLTLYYYEDRSIAEVAEMLAMPEGTVKTHLYRARAALIEQLRRRGLDDPGIWLEVRR